MTYSTEIQKLYEKAKRGKWFDVLEAWKRNPEILRHCAHHQNPITGRTFLHHAACFGHEKACRLLIACGVTIDARSRKEQTAADVAEENQFPLLAALLRHAAAGSQSIWRAPADASCLPASSLFGEAIERLAGFEIPVAYGGGVVRIPKGSRYFTDSFQRALVGWHGTYDPPRGMDGESMVKEARA